MFAGKELRLALESFVGMGRVGGLQVEQLSAKLCSGESAKRREA